MNALERAAKDIVYDPVSLQLKQKKQVKKKQADKEGGGGMKDWDK